MKAPSTYWLLSFGEVGFVKKDNDHGMLTSNDRTCLSFPSTLYLKPQSIVFCSLLKDMWSI